MSFLKVFGKILQTSEKVGVALGPEVATAINPAAGMVVASVVDSVARAEQAGGTGASKKEAVVKEVLPVATTALSETLKKKHPNAAVDPAELSKAVGGIVDGVVGLMNSVREKPAATGAGAAGKP